MIVEDGTGKENANSYVTIAEATEYFTASNDEVWLALSEDAQKAGLIRATRYIDMRYGPVLTGTPKTSTQALFYPANDAVNVYGYTETGVPRYAKVAVMEAARAEQDEPLFAVDDKSERVSEFSAGSLSVKMSGLAPTGKVIEAVDRAISRLINNRVRVYRV